MKKRILVLLTALLLTSCAPQANEVSKQSEVSEISTVSEVSEEISKETSKEVSKKVSEVSEESKKESSAEVSKEISKEESKKVSEVSEESKKESSAEVSEISGEVAEYPRQIVENIVDIENLGDKTKEYTQKSLESKDIYINATGRLAIFGGMEIKFHAEIAKSDSGVAEKFTFGKNSVKILRNSEGTYLIDDVEKRAVLTGEPYNPDEKLQTEDGLTQNSIANEILQQLSLSFGLDKLEYKGSGTEKYKGRELNFEEYNADGENVKIYFDGDKPVYMVGTDGSNISEIVVNTITDTPDEDMFVIPEGYAIVQ